MATKEWLLEHRKKCIDCGELISYRSVRCYSCDNKNKYNLGLKKSWEGKFKKIITKESLIDLYINKKKNCYEIAFLFNCGKSTICNYLDKFNIISSSHTRDSWKKSHIGRNNPRFGKLASHGKRIKYNNISFRSSWEYKFAKWLEQNNIKWLYESQTFDLGDSTYTPDFYLLEFNLYIEVKGWWRDNALKKFLEFKQKYCGERIKVVDKLELQSIGVLK